MKQERNMNGVPEWIKETVEEVNAVNESRNHVLRDCKGFTAPVMPSDELAAIIVKHAPDIDVAKTAAAEAGTRIGMLTCAINHLGTFEQVRELVEAARDEMNPAICGLESVRTRLRRALEPFTESRCTK